MGHLSYHIFAVSLMIPKCGFNRKGDAGATAAQTMEAGGLDLPTAQGAKRPQGQQAGQDDQAPFGECRYGYRAASGTEFGADE